MFLRTGQVWSVQLLAFGYNLEVKRRLGKKIWKSWRITTDCICAVLSVAVFVLIILSLTGADEFFFSSSLSIFVRDIR